MKTSQEASFEVDVREANNVTLTEPDQFEGYCELCKTVKQLMNGVRKKMSIFMVSLLVILVAIFTIYLVCVLDTLLLKQVNATSVNTTTLYILFALEFIILCSVLYARYE